MDITSVAGIGTLYSTWQCDLPGGVYVQSPKTFNNLRVFKAWK